MELKEIRKVMAESRFCYARSGGQGYVNKSECICTNEEPCQAKKDQERYHAAFEGMEYGDTKRRREIVQDIKPKFQDSQWWKDNVIE